MKKILGTLVSLATAVICIGFMLVGYSAGRAFPEVQVITKTEYRWLPPVVRVTEYVVAPPAIITKIEKVEKVVEKIVTVNQTVFVTQNVTLKDWQSVEEFLAWVKPLSYRVIVVIGRDTVCSDYAQDLQRRALEQGYAVSLALIDKQGYIYDVYIAEPSHMGNLVVINKVAYYVDVLPGLFRMIKVTPIY